MYSKWIFAVVSLTLCFVCLCMVSQSAHASISATSGGVTVNMPSDAIHVTMAQTVTLTNTISYTRYYTETQAVFLKLAETVRPAELFRFRGVKGTFISIYDPSQFGLYEEERKNIADLCPDCYEPQCAYPPCVSPYSLPCCGIADRCVVAPTPGIELEPERLAYPESVVAEHPEQLDALEEHYAQDR